MDRGRTRSRGFTLVELMIVITVIVILMSTAPSFVTIVKNNRQTLQINSLLLALTAARDEAIKRNGAVSVCQTADGSECTDDNWANGWMVFVDGETEGRLDDDDTVLQIFPPVDNDTTLTSAVFPEYIAYLSDGTANTAGSFTMCDDRGSDYAVSLCVAATGRLNAVRDDCSGEAIVCP